MHSFSDQGIVLRKRPLKEKDELIIVLSQEHGKVPLMSYGSRDPRSRKSGVVELFNTIQFEARRSKTKMPTLQQVKLVTSRGYQVVERDQSLDEFYRAAAMVKLTDQYLHEEQDVQNVYNDLHEALHYVQVKSIDVIFWVRLLSDLGFLPDWSSCSLCDEKLDLAERIVWDAEHRGFTHGSCSHGTIHEVSADMVKVLSYWQRSRVAEGAQVQVQEGLLQGIRNLLETVSIH